MNSFWKNLFGVQEKKICKHDKNYRKLKFHAPDGTPMIEFACHDCGYKDEGHVTSYINADGSSDWENRLIIASDGKIIIDEHGKSR